MILKQNLAAGSKGYGELVSVLKGHRKWHFTITVKDLEVSQPCLHQNKLKNLQVLPFASSFFYFSELLNKLQIVQNI